MEYFFANGGFAGTGYKDCTVAICEGNTAVSFAKEWKTVGKKLEFVSYGIDKQARLFKNALREINGISDEDKETFLFVLGVVCNVRKNTLNAKAVRTKGGV